MPVYLDTRGNSVLSVAICDRCNRKFAYTDLMPDPNFPGMRVCKDDKDNFDPWRLPARQTENISLRFPRPDVSIALQPNLVNTQGHPNDPDQYDNLYLDGILPASGSQGNLSTTFNQPGLPTNLIPSIGQVTPNTGAKAGGYTVTILGANFTNISTVKFGGEIAQFVIVNSTTITATVPQYGTTGAVTVTAGGPFGTAIAENIFTYTP